MNKYKRLIPAMCLLLISAVLLGTSTFAWFSMNRRVTATGMQVTATTDNIFLQIENVNGDSTNAAKTEAAAVASSATIRPTDYMMISSSGEVTWGRTNSDDPNDEKYTAKALLEEIGSSALPGYIWTDTFHIFVAQNANANEGHNLVLESVTVDDGGATIDMQESLRVLVVGPDGAMLWANAGAMENSSAVASSATIDYKNTSSTVLAEDIDSVGVDVVVYIYFCGNDESVTTNNAQNLGLLSIELTFTCES